MKTTWVVNVETKEEEHRSTAEYLRALCPQMLALSSILAGTGLVDEEGFPLTS